MFDLIIFYQNVVIYAALWNKQFLIFHIKTILKSLFFMFHSEMHHIMDVKQAVNAVDFEEVLLCLYINIKNIFIVIPVAQTVEKGIMGH